MSAAMSRLLMSSITSVVVPGVRDGVVGGKRSQRVRSQYSARSQLIARS
jgi:hypothetical protein